MRKINIRSKVAAAGLALGIAAGGAALATPASAAPAAALSGACAVVHWDSAHPTSN